jgi:hypothetical protein
MNVQYYQTEPGGCERSVGGVDKHVCTLSVNICLSTHKALRIYVLALSAYLCFSTTHTTLLVMRSVTSLVTRGNSPRNLCNTTCTMGVCMRSWLQLSRDRYPLETGVVTVDRVQYLHQTLFSVVLFYSPRV